MSSLENKDNILDNSVDNSAENNAEATAAPRVPVETPQTDSEQQPAPSAETTTQPEEKAYSHLSREELVAELGGLIENAKASTVGEIKNAVEAIKQAFYKHQKEQNSLQDKGEEEVVEKITDSVEEKLKELLGKYKEIKASANAILAEQKDKNLKLKEEILAKLEELTNSTEDLSTTIPAFRKLQQEWKNIGQIPQSAVNEIWKTYNKYQEKFYDLIKINNELREYDFKKNLELKEKLCESAEKLSEEKDVISAFHQLQELHQAYREIGPVSKELREQIWGRFKAASTIINKKHQQHFEDLRANEEENLEKKTVLCEKAEAIAAKENKGAADWEKHTKEMLEIQAEWKTIGFAPQKMNVKIFERFRKACDAFFTQKAAFFKETRERYTENIEKKRKLIEKAQALADSTEWRSTGDKLIALQKEWKTIGMVPRKIGDKLWEEFLTACNKFFEARNAVHADSRSEERENLSKKRQIVDQLKEMLQLTADDLQEKVKLLVDEYSQIGHVPYKEKNKLYDDFHETLDKLYKKLNISATHRKLDEFKTNLKNMAQRGADMMDNERGRLLRRYEAIKSEVQTYENNLGFLNASSKKGNSLIDEMNRKVQKLKDDMELVRQKIKAIDQQNKEQQP